MPIQRAKPIAADIPVLNASSLPTIPVANMPTGSIIQTVRTELAASLQYTDADGDIMSVNITPLLSDSNLLISAYLQWSIMENEGGDWGIRLRENSSGSENTILGDDQNGYFISGGGVDTYDWVGQGSNAFGVNFASKTDYYTGRTAGTSQFTVKLRHESQQNNTNVRYMRDGWGGGGVESQRSRCVLLVHEIAA